MKLYWPVEGDFGHIFPLKKPCSSTLCQTSRLLCTRTQTTCADRRNNKSASVDPPWERGALHPAPTLFVLCICCLRMETPADRATLWALYLTEAASSVLCFFPLFFFWFPVCSSQTELLSLTKIEAAKTGRVSLAVLQYERFIFPNLLRCVLVDLFAWFSRTYRVRIKCRVETSFEIW